MSRRTHLPHMLALAALLAAFGSAPVQAQQASENAAGATTKTPRSDPGASPNAAGQGKSGSSATSSSGATSGGMSGDQSASAKGLSKADSNMLRDMAQTNLAEIEAGKLAMEKTQNPEVKEFAQRMIDDHTKGLEQVKQLAQAKGVDVPNEPDAKHKAMVKKLSALSGDKFDRQYMSQGGVNDHSKADAMLKKAATNAKDPDVKSLAQNMKSTVDQHLKMAKQTSSDVKKGTATGSSGTAGASGSSGKANGSGGSGK